MSLVGFSPCPTTFYAVKWVIVSQKKCFLCQVTFQNQKDGVRFKKVNERSIIIYWIYYLLHKLILSLVSYMLWVSVASDTVYPFHPRVKVCCLESGIAQYVHSLHLLVRSLAHSPTAWKGSRWPNCIVLIVIWLQRLRISFMCCVLSTVTFYLSASKQLLSITHYLAWDNTLRW